jgi:hypothetical protein
MTVAAFRLPRFASLLICGVALVSSGCAPGDVQLNGKVFDMLGSATGLNSGGPTETKIAARPGLVVPPTLDRLPEPGSATVPDGDLAQIVDFDQKKVVDKAALEGKQREYCKINYEQPKQRGDTTTADLAVGPLGPCRPSAMGLISEINGVKQ